MAGGDHRLQQVGARGWRQDHRAVQTAETPPDKRPIPSAAILVEQKDWIARLVPFLRDLAPGLVSIEPLQNFPIERDLVVTVGDFVRKIESIYPYIMPKVPKTVEVGTYLQTPGQMEEYASFADCINCMLCYAACPQFGANPDFIGPGAMALLQRYSSDSRDGGQVARLERIRGEDGVWSYTAVGICSEVCPKQVDPANAVNQNKSKSALDFFLSRLRKENVA
ncbi:4Fe-4S dicluster domain-containing protein [Bradyrhizobium iriomotense]|uniref:4Fe-4S dicluster domain-containing protein n=1 Tax=Bradyrhizobium iriomotense TaxID=441950 RepID=UPI001FEFBB39|nr:4Fe-4S dicluster domain-containing protein [Bradyrhizobium iriomotense]